MKQIEVTTRVNMKLNEVDKTLKKQGFRIIRQSRIEDNYMTQKFNELNSENIIDILKNCVLIRYLCVDKKEEFKRITYKKKIYKDDLVISEEKISVIINDIEKAKKIFEALNFKTIVEVNYDVIVYAKEGVELAFQNVENLGLLVEFENDNDFENYNAEEIIKIKKEMLKTIKNYNIDVTNDFDVKKAYEIIKREFDN